MEIKIVLSVAFVAVIIFGFFWRQLLNVLLLFIPEKKEIHGVVFDLIQEKSDTLVKDLPANDFTSSIPEIVKVVKYFITVKTEEGGFVKIKTDKLHFINLKKGEKFDFKVTQPIFSDELVLE